MNIEFIKEERNGRLVLIFAGWGSDAGLYKDIVMDGWDTAVVSGYESAELNIDRLSAYSSIYVYAWSMGVWAASFVLPRHNNVDAAFAINGTLTPRSDTEGIPAGIYDGTEQTLNERNLRKFRLRMAGDRETADKLNSLLPDAADTALIEKLRGELRFIAKTPAADTRGLWTRAYVSGEDRIFAADTQRRFWEERGVEVHPLKGSHYISLKKLVEATIHDLKKVGHRFGDALDTYDSHAQAQRDIAMRLTEMIEGEKPATGGRVIELGSGSGLFTRMWTEVLRPAEVTYIDLYPTPVYGCAEREIYIVGDAEAKVAEESEERYDALVSASTIQWFVSPRTFFRNAAAILKPGGLIAVSSFTKGNLRELDALRPSPIVYRTAKELEAWASENFTDVRVMEEEIPMRFKSAREALLHLKHTGVGGSISTGSQGSELARKLATADGSVTLTYRGVYLIARKGFSSRR